MDIAGAAEVTLIALIRQASNGHWCGIIAQDDADPALWTVLSAAEDEDRDVVMRILERELESMPWRVRN